MVRTVIGVLRGGPSSEYDLSLKSGAAFHAAFDDDAFLTRDIFVDKDGVWHSRGIPTDPARALSQVDIAVNLMHGGPGEDGTVSRILDRLSVPYIGSGAHPSALSLNKPLTREMLIPQGVRMPQGVAFSLGDGIDTGTMARLVFERFGPPYVVKPAAEGSSHGIRIADTILDLPHVLADVLDDHAGALVEEFVIGPEVTVGIIDGFRGEEFYALPLSEVRRPSGSRHIERSMIMSGALSYHCPASFAHDVKRAAESLAKAAHRGLGLSDYSQADIILSRHGPVLIEINAIPMLHEKAPFPRMLEAVGSSIRGMYEHLITRVRKLI